jgi:hypothetical protein
MNALCKSHLFRLAAIFRAATRVAPSAVGGRALNHSKFFARMTVPTTSFTARTYDRLVHWFSQHWPDGVEWPAEIVRPTAKPAAPAPSEAAA